VDAENRKALARKRILSVLGKQIVANARTLEQKISDAGPSGMRIDPHILTPVRKTMIDEGILQSVTKANNIWFHLANLPQTAVEPRLNELANLFHESTLKQFPQRLGQTLEIATYRALVATDGLEFFGRFKDLDTHDDSELYSKEEPPSHIGARILPGSRLLDFIVRHPTAGPLGLECKNVREWVYPDREEVKELLLKCTTLDAVPVLIARRIPFVTFKLLSTAGVIVHQTYNQLLPSSDVTLAKKLRQKDLLGYHDIRLGNEPNTRLVKFIAINMPRVAPAARERFNTFKDLLAKFGSGEMTYKQFAARVRRRSEGKNEDHDWDQDGDPADF
jgi:hypothetical protein